MIYEAFENPHGSFTMCIHDLYGKFGASFTQKRETLQRGVMAIII